MMVEKIDVRGERIVVGVIVVRVEIIVVKVGVIVVRVEIIVVRVGITIVKVGDDSSEVDMLGVLV